MHASSSWAPWPGIVPGDPVALVSSGAPFRDKTGHAVSHFALVRGSAGKLNKGLDNGPFPVGGAELHVSDIGDGTTKTLYFSKILGQQEKIREVNLAVHVKVSVRESNLV